MAQCIEFPPNLSDNACFFATNLVVTPILLILGIITNFLCIIVLNIGTIRKSNPSFIYLSGLAVIDFTSLLCLVPRYIQDTQGLTPQQTYSKLMTYFIGTCYIIRAIALHVSTWYIALASVAFVLRIRTSTSLKPGWTKLSISRIVVFALCLASAMLNLPRFFEHRVEPLSGHCFEGVTFWQLHLTYLGDSVVYKELYQWIVISVAFIAPLTTIFITNIVLMFRLGIKRFCTNNQCLVRAFTEDYREFQLGKCVFALACVTLFTYTPYTVVQFFITLHGEASMMSVKGFYELELISEALLLLRMVLPGVLYCLAYGDFHRTLCRILCCSADEYYEPCACVYLTCARKEEHIDTGILDQTRAEENATLERNAKRGNGYMGSSIKTNPHEFSRWI